ncbi:MAG: metallophosphoesterase [Deltaproteobacteria bacterium]|jgi:predicted MPP superfamily phosphohydrolase|nr:metallophosphoesterase [Deltaproteobacteria bacterium]
MNLYRLTLLILLALGQVVAWLWWSKRVKSVWLKTAIKTVYVMVNLVGVLAIAQMYILELLPVEHFIFSRLYRPALTWLFGHAAWLTGAFGLWLLAQFVRLWPRRGPKGLPRLFRAQRVFPLVPVVTLAWFLTMGLVFYAYNLQLKPAAVKRTTITIKSLPPELEGFRIVHLSDFHYGLGLDLVEVDQRLNQAASLKPDLVILTGDFLDSLSSLARDWQEPLRNLRGVPFGVYGVLGNHDLYANNPGEEAQVLTNFGARILRDEAISLAGLPLTIIGFDDPGTASRFYRPDAQSDVLDFSRIKGLPAPANNMAIVVRHRPQGVESAAKFGAKLYLAGHTHGGQFQVPFKPRWNLMTISSAYTQGSYQIGDLNLLISNGLSSAGLPFRLWAWPQMDLITLTKNPETARGPHPPS